MGHRSWASNRPAKAVLIFWETLLDSYISKVYSVQFRRSFSKISIIFFPSSTEYATMLHSKLRHVDLLSKLALPTEHSMPSPRMNLLWMNPRVYSNTLAPALIISAAYFLFAQ